MENDKHGYCLFVVGSPLESEDLYTCTYAKRRTTNLSPTHESPISSKEHRFILVHGLIG